MSDLWSALEDFQAAFVLGISVPMPWCHGKRMQCRMRRMRRAEGSGQGQGRHELTEFTVWLVSCTKDISKILKRYQKIWKGLKRYLNINIIHIIWYYIIYYIYIYILYITISKQQDIIRIWSSNASCDFSVLSLFAQCAIASPFRSPALHVGGFPAKTRRSSCTAVPWQCIARSQSESDGNVIVWLVCSCLENTVIGLV